jgi:hypothetical protein
VAGPIPDHHRLDPVLPPLGAPPDALQRHWPRTTALDALDEIGATNGVPDHPRRDPHLSADPGTGTNSTAPRPPAVRPPTPARPSPGRPRPGARSPTPGALTFDVPAGTYGFFGLFNASTGNTNNYLGYIPFGGASALKGFGTVDTTLTNDQLFSRAHGMSDTDRVILFNVFAETLPTGLTEGTVYYVVSSATNTFKVSTTSGGSAVDITALGGGEFYWQRVVPEVFAAQGQITVAASALVLDATAM